MSESTLADLKLAVTEACANAVRHAQPSAHGVVSLRFELEADSIEVAVEDEGPGIPELPEGGPLDSDELSESGMGLEIIRAIVDDLEIGARPDGQGTVVRMRKRLA